MNPLQLLPWLDAKLIDEHGTGLAVDGKRRRRVTNLMEPRHEKAVRPFSERMGPDVLAEQRDGSIRFT
jgi:hypothetical protein